MSNYNSLLHLPEIERKKLYKRLLRDQKYKCAECNITHGKYHLKNNRSNYVVLDEHERKYHLSRGEQVVLQYLRMFENRVLLCPHHFQIAIAEQIRETRSNRLEDLTGFKRSDVQLIQNFCKHNIGIEPSLSTAVKLIVLIKSIK